MNGLFQRWKRKASTPAGVSNAQVERIVASLFPAVLDNRPDQLDTTLAAAGVDAKHRGFYIQLALDTLEVLLSKDEDKQSHPGMVAAMVAKDVDAELAKLLLNAASMTMLRRDQASPGAAKTGSRNPG